MSRIIQCPSCEKQLKLGDATSQKSVISCPVCSQKIRINSEPETNRPAAPESTKPSQRKRPATAQPSHRDESPKKRRAAASSNSRQRSSGQPKPQKARQSQTAQVARRSRRTKDAGGNAGPSAWMIGGGACVVLLLMVTALWWAVNKVISDDESEPLVAQTESESSQQDNSNAKTNENLFPNGSSSGRDSLGGSGNQPSLGSGGNDTQTFPPNNARPDNNAQPDNSSPSSPPPSNEAPKFNGQPSNPPPAGRNGKGIVVRYGLKPGDTHVYTFELDAELDGQSVSFPGTVSFGVTRGRTGGADEVVSGTGTGFLVSSSGHLITCHHVIEGATDVQVVLDGKTYPGSVIASDPVQDLAIVKINGRNLPFVNLANSNSVQLAEDVRAIGYPLTDLLGEGLKVTKGTISGINEDANERRFQVDAQINPGNSGGPLFNAKGQVIAINVAKLISGSEITSVGFSVPVNYATQLLQRNGIKIRTDNGGRTLDGPTLVRTVRPSIALLKVESRHRVNPQFVLNYSGSYRDTMAQRSMGRTIGPPGFGGGRFAPPRITVPGMPSTLYSRGRVILDEFGSVEGFEDSQQLPFSTGSMAMLMIHQMNPDGATSWNDENSFVLTKPKKNNRSNPFGFPGSQLGGPFGPRERDEPDEILTHGIEKHGYRIIDSNDKEIRIARTYELRTLDHPTTPMTKITGSGTIIFDRAYSMPKSMSYRQTYESRSEGKLIRVPIAISYRMQDPAILKERREKLAQAAAEKKAETEEKARREAEMSPSDRLDFYLVEIKAGRGRDVFKKLAEMEVIERRKSAVSAVLAPCLKERRPNGDQLAALGKWATPKVVGLMIQKLELMDSNDWSAGTKLVTALGQTGDKRAIKPIAKKLASTSHPWHGPATIALKGFGAEAEDTVLMLMEISPSKEAVKLLGEIGTKKSISVLKKMTEHKDYWIKKEAKEALTAVVLRTS